MPEEERRGFAWRSAALTERILARDSRSPLLRRLALTRVIALFVLPVSSRFT